MNEYLRTDYKTNVSKDNFVRDRSSDINTQVNSQAQLLISFSSRKSTENQNATSSKCRLHCTILTTHCDSSRYVLSF